MDNQERFKAVSSRISFPQMEEAILQQWDRENIFQKSVEARKDGPIFTFYEGPPTANGNPGIHHVLSRAFKDVIPRYRAMKGYYVPRIAGWDTHGLPVELEIEKHLGFTSKAQIENYGISKFNDWCRQSVWKYKEQWDKLTERMAYWVDLNNPYITFENSYVESVWWSLKQMFNKGLIYKGYKVTPHCPRCGTSLSSHEIAQGYKDNTVDPSVFVKFEIDSSTLSAAKSGHDIYAKAGRNKIYLLAWTTTPWTLPANTAAAVSAKDSYVLLQKDDSYLIMAQARQDSAGLGDWTTLAQFKGVDMLGIKYIPLFNPHDYDVPCQIFKKGTPELLSGSIDATLRYPVITADFVSMEDGTGIVHNAPAYGETDYQAGIDNGLAFIHYVNMEGKITGDYTFGGMFVKKADKYIVAELEKHSNILKAEVIEHTYPFCWRCDSPVLYMAKQSWYIRTTEYKQHMINGNEKINWYPEYVKEGRFGDWLRNNVDWAISRERYWGTPLPIWICDQCGKIECAGSVIELNNKPSVSGLSDSLDLHRPHVDNLKWPCECGGCYVRTPEVIDCWYDSGAMPFAQFHYPFENKSMMKDGRFPADFICEAVDQTRGWFYSLHAISNLVFEENAYKNVICLGHILDGKGEKMSKRRGNVVDPFTVINKYGADAVRWYLYTASPPGNARRFSEGLVAEAQGKFINTLWNTYSFFVLYANIDGYNPLTDRFSGELAELDKWILSELNELIKNVDGNLADYDPTSAGRQIEEFVDYLSNWYVRRSRRRFWKSESDSDKLGAYQTLYACLTTLARLLAPFMPFIADEMYQNLVCSIDKSAPASVHLVDFPFYDESLIDYKLEEAARLAMKLSSVGRAARAKVQIKVRQPLAFAVAVVAAKEHSYLAAIKDQVEEELNIKDLRFVVDNQDLNSYDYVTAEDGGYTVAIYLPLSQELEWEGFIRDYAHRIQGIRKDLGLEIADRIILAYDGSDYAKEVIASFDDFVAKETLAQKIIPQNLQGAEGVTEFKINGHHVVVLVQKT
ncbi:MAG: isoleucine--tRNA ligase [Chloroflexi bacterium]|nr:isoleucine--tRNA ligase [Chloroflexota bacterium]